MENSKIILLIGRSGRGKSALSNVITGTNDFKESSGSISETKRIQLGGFKENSVDYQIIDTPGIGDTKMSDGEVLNIIAEAVYLAKNGVNQVFFVTNGRFDQYEMATYDLLRTIIFDNDITKHTTIVRTRFDKFKKKEACQADIDLMIKEASEKRAELEQNISDKEKELADLSSDSAKHQELSAEIEKAKKELAATNLAEIIESCQGRVVYVNNPSLEVEDDELELNKGKREKSRKILLEHLNKVSQGEPYNPANLKELSEDIAEDYFQYLKKKEELQKELEEEMKKLNSRTDQSSVTSQDSLNQTSNIDRNQAELIAEETQVESKENIAIVGKKEHDKIIAELQDKKERLKKEIAEKEKMIHQKVLKHIFNNYDKISKESGGDIFLNSVTGDHNWQEVHPDFSNKEFVVKWLSHGFDYQQTQKWATALINFNPKTDADFCAWLRDKKQLTVEGIKRASYPQNIERWRNEYESYLQKEVEVLDKHNEQLLDQEKDWKEIHEDFDNYYQQKWKERGLTYEQAQQWINISFTPSDYDHIWWIVNIQNQSFDPNLKVEESKKEFKEYQEKLNQEWGNIHKEFKIGHAFYWIVNDFDYQATKLWIGNGFMPYDYDKAKKWKEQNFTTEQIKQWLNKGLNKANAKFVKFLLDKGCTLDTFPNDEQLKELKEEYLKNTNDWSVIHEDFASYQKSWEEANITYQEVQEWINSGFKPSDYYSVKEWKKKDFDYNQVKEWIDVGLKPSEYEFFNYLKEKNYQLNTPNIKEIITQESWRDIHPGFEYSYRKSLEEARVNYSETREWIQIEFKPEDYKKVKQWKNHNFTSQEAKSWKDIGLTEDDVEFVAYLRWKDIQSSSGLNLEQLKEEFTTWLKKEKPTQEYLDTIYPKSQRKEITELNIKEKNLQGSLDLSDFVNLERLDCDDNRLTGLNLSGLNKLGKIRCLNNGLTGIDLSGLSSDKLTSIVLNDNPLSGDLSIFKRFRNLEGLFLGNTAFSGSLESLEDCSGLQYLNIRDTDIDSGLEYLPEGVKVLWCLVKKRKDAKVKVIYDLFAGEKGGVETESGITNFPQKLQAYKQKLQIKPQIEEALVSNNITSEQLTEQLTKNNYLTDFANTWQKYLDTAQTPEELNLRKNKILTSIENLKAIEQQAQILQPPKPPKK